MNKNYTYISRLIIFLIMNVMWVNAWADTWDGTEYSFGENKFADEGLTVDGHDGKSWEKAYVITTARQFAYFAWIVKNNKNGRGSNYYWKLGADIDIDSHTWNYGANTGNSFQGHFDGGGHTISNVSLSVTTNSNYGLFPTIQGASSTSLAEVKNLKIDGVTFTSASDRAGNTKLGALTGYVKNAKISGISVNNVSVTYEGNITGNNYIGGIVGQIEGSSGGNEQTQMKNCAIDSVKISLAGTFEGAANIGGAIGLLSGYTLVDGIVVKNGSITGPTSDKIVKNNTAVFIGGAIGQQSSSGTTNYQPNKFMNVAVSGMIINLGHYLPESTVYNHKFAVGGIAGSVNAPNQDALGNRGMPENLIAKSLKIYAPFAAVSPTVANFNAGTATQTTYSSEYITAVDAIEQSKRGSWLYTDYQLGLSKSVLAGTNAYNATSANGKVKRNYSKATTQDADDSNLEWLEIDDKTFLKKNRHLDMEYESWTVLWWTRTDNNATYANNDIDQTLYPQNGNTDIPTFASSQWKYYMYFYQGISNAKYISTENATKIIEGIDANVTEAAKDAPVVLTITNNLEGKRGFAPRTFTVSASAGSYSYAWYVDGKPAGTGSSITVTPHWKLGQSIRVNAESDGKVVASAGYALKAGVFKTKNSDEEVIAIADRGTASNPYIIESQEALRQLSYLSTLSTSILWDGLAKPASPFPTNQSQGHYNRAYYELGADITMSQEPFIPISHMGTNGDGGNGTYSQNWIFQGSFDGKGHKISGLNITWSAGQYNGSGAHVYHGLFGAVGNTTATAKWGEGSTSPTVIKNLIIDGATLTHDPSNTSFYYNNGTSGNANNCYVGVLAGIVSSNTTVQNIEIRNSIITDDGSQEYSLATCGLFVGGAIGSYQTGFSKTDGVLTGSTIQHIAAQVDITLTHPAFVDNTAAGQVWAFNVGGIIGRYSGTGATVQQVRPMMPAYTFYSGNINAPDAWISPVLASLRYKDNFNNTASFNFYTRQWEGNNNSAATQLAITNAQYYNFRINGTLMTDLYPGSKCSNNARPILPHAESSDAATTYDTKKYQGVNYGARFIDSDGTTLKFLNESITDGVYWKWEDGFPHMTEQQPVDAYLTRSDNDFTAELTEGTGSAYEWIVSFDGQDWQTLDGATLQTFNADASNKPKLIVAIVSYNGTKYRTQAEYIDASLNQFEPHIEKTGDSSAGYTFTVTWKDDKQPTTGTLSTTYQWYKSDRTTQLAGQTSSSLALSQSDLTADGGYVWCEITVKELGATASRWMLVAGDLTVVYLNGNGYTGNGSGVGNDGNDGRTPQTPVLTIGKANGLLKTPAEGGTWDNNIIVVMGRTSTATNESGCFKSRGTNPATLTGKWDGVDYEGVINMVKTSSENGVNPGDGLGKTGHHNYISADTKFENITFQAAHITDNIFLDLYGHDAWFGKGIKVTEIRNLSKAHGNLGMVETIPEFSIILTATNLGHPEEAYWTRTKPQILTIESGHYGRILGGRYTGKFFPDNGNTSKTILATPQHPAWAIINIDIDPDNDMNGTITYSEGPNNGKKITDATYTCDINCIVAGLTDGTIYGDYEINIHGGSICYAVGANQGNSVVNGNKTFTPVGGTNGTWGQWPNASFFGRTIINVEQKDGMKPIDIRNLYAGGLGRNAEEGAAVTIPVDMYFYGETGINIKSGKVTGSVYGGGAGGVIGKNPWDSHTPHVAPGVPSSTANQGSAILNGVQYGDSRVTGAWSTQSADAPLIDVVVHKRDENGHFIQNADGTYPTETINLGNSSTTINIHGGSIGENVYGGGKGYVPNMPVGGAMQGVGSVFGTSNINISGGTINGSIYGGSEGASNYYGQTNKYGQKIIHIAELIDTVNLKITGTPTIGGDIYGGGKGIASSGGEEYLRIATVGNADLGEQYKTDVKILIDLPESHPFNGNIYGGGALGAVDGTTKVVIKGGMINGDVFGGGQGENDHPNKAKVTGNAEVIVDKDWTEPTPKP